VHQHDPLVRLGISWPSVPRHLRQEAS
jgi:hypothetical protein